SAVNRRRFADLDFSAVADFELTRKLVDAAAAHGVAAKTGPILSSDHFYQPRPEVFDLSRKLGLLGVEMEAAALFGVAAEHGVKAATILTVVDIIGKEENVHPDDREASLREMAAIALDAAIAG
ncbi:MAG: purine-nucleoside phosphorylase, partial [Acidimicrobiia bacterium]|nr:purine-nucleoside phosphorylase [Acidimicrobiia bacterium]